MIQADIDDRSRTGRIILKPNASWSWQANLGLLYTLVAISGSIAVGFLIEGVWIVLPYSLIELSALALCIYSCVRACNKQEVITVSEHEVFIERGIREPEQRWQYHRMWAKFLVKAPRHPWRSTVVAIRSHGDELELGSFLNDPDKEELISTLKRVVPADRYPSVTV
ncbi:MAG TPA: DUF2244 domain-containing protein [Pseudomonadales bacterium]|nr:DUF2244 domain-containing protein [Pseudomonadales bacterium]